MQPPGRFGAVHLENDAVTRFQEKPEGDNAWINGGFFVLEPSVLTRIEGDATVWEAGPLEGLARAGQLMAYRHTGFWHALDTLRDKNALEHLWNSGKVSVEGLELTRSFWQGKRVLVTGHTGFKGSWLALWLQRLGAHVGGFALPAEVPSAYELFHLERYVDSHFGDVRDIISIQDAVARVQPEIVFHMASQAILREGLRDPAATFSTNVLGLVNLIEVLRRCSRPIVLINVTSDKVYEAAPDGTSRTESDALGGEDPYSASKACAELVTRAYRSTILSGNGLRVSSARAGNVIGGGDFAADRIVPDIVRAVCKGEEVILRYPDAIRPWQHVMDPLCGYLTLAQSMVTRGRAIDGAYNFGPAEKLSAVSVAELTSHLLESFGFDGGWRQCAENQPPESQTLRIDSGKAQRTLGWMPQLTISQAVRWTVLWYERWRSAADVREFSLQQIEAYERGGVVV